MFGIGRKTRDIITLFHKPSSAASIRVANLLKQTSATASETATEDQAADHTAQNKIQRSEFDIDITEAPPTSDQLRTIFEYTGGRMVGNYIKGATNQEDAFKKLRESADAFQRPVVVDWSNGKVVAGENESEILKLLRSTNPKDP